MDSKFSRISTLVVIAGLTIWIQAARADVAAIAAGCDGCHGENGISSQDDMPTIAGIDAFSHSEALFVYAERARPCATVAISSGPDAVTEGNMCDIAAAMSEGDIEEIAEHYAALPFVPAKQPFDAALAEAGKAIHDKSCGRCHSDGGSNPEDEAGILAGQWAGYLRTTFAEYAAGERDQPGRMKQVMDPLSDDDVEALVNYYASQQ